MPLIGTAGHVDHGKSTLVLALSGRDPDRWAEEKRRGLTIDLGFAWADIGGGVEVSFVDVPGHERYLKNMLAGVDAIDIAILVVAANEGWMPQTEEHLAVLDLLGVSSGVVALTKVDMVGSEISELASAEVDDRLEGTSLAGSVVVPVAAPSGSGITELRAELLRLCEALTPPEGERARLWVDRSFSVPGAGTVVTGSLLGGILEVGDEVRIYPGTDTARIRSLQSHEKDVVRALPGTRVAISLVGPEVSDIGRGDMVAREGQWRTTDRLVVSIKPARYVDEVTPRGAYQMHIGTATLNARILRLEGERALISVDRPVAATMGDRFILRDTGRRSVVAGGAVLDPAPSPGSLAAKLNAQEPPDTRAARLLAIRGMDRLADIVTDSGGGTPEDAVTVGDLVVSSSRLNLLTAAAEQKVRLDHEERPMRSGIPMATLAGALDAPRSIVERAVRESTLLEVRGPDVAIKGHEASLDLEAARVWDDARSRLSADLAVPTVGELGVEAELLHLLIRRGDLVRVSENLVYLPDQIAGIIEIVARLEVPFGVGEFKDALGLSRKYAVPILEWLDDRGYTIRRGEGRFPGPGSGSGG
ncbi:MAG: selenocysteine-specific translation elongation factor [Acidimicrobiia bacterium]